MLLLLLLRSCFSHEANTGVIISKVPNDPEMWVDGISHLICPNINTSPRSNRLTFALTLYFTLPKVTGGKRYPPSPMRYCLATSFFPPPLSSSEPLRPPPDGSETLEVPCTPWLSLWRPPHQSAT